VGDNLMGIDLINKLELSYRASTNSLFAITMDEEGWLVTRQETTFKPQSVMILNLRTPGGKVKLEKEDRILVQVEHGSFPTLTGGPALATWRTNGHCTVAITNVAPHEVFCPQNTPLVRMDRLASGVQPTKMDARVAVLEKPQEHWTQERIEAMRQQLENQGTPSEARQEVLRILQEEVCVSTSTAPKELLHLKYKSVEPHYQKQTKIPEAYQDLVARQIQQWLKLGLVRIHVQHTPHVYPNKRGPTSGTRFPAA
jgi:hypothetical protein